MPQFDLTTGHINCNVFIIYNSRTGINIFNSATEKLKEIFDDKYKCTNLFNDKISEISKM